MSFQQLQKSLSSRNLLILTLEGGSYLPGQKVRCGKQAQLQGMKGPEMRRGWDAQMSKADAGEARELF